MLTVKGNQGNLKEQLAEHYNHVQERFPEIVRHCTTVDKGHGRIEKREIFVIETSNSGLNFEGVAQIAKLKRARTIIKSGKTTEEEIYLITNLSIEQAEAEQLMFLKRDYWSIENKLHYRKDFVFGEDRSTIRAEHGPANMASLRNFANSLLMANEINNVKRCVDNLKYQNPSILHQSLFPAKRLQDTNHKYRS